MKQICLINAKEDEKGIAGQARNDKSFHMKIRLNITFIGLILLVTGIKAQDVNQRIISFLGQGDWFALEEEFSKNKDSIQPPAIRILAETMIALHFNQPEKVLSLVDSIIHSNYQEVLGFETISNIVLMRGVTLREMGYYQESANFIKDFLSQVSELTKIEGFPYHIEDFPNHISLAKMSEEMHNNHYPNPEIIRPNKDTEIPVTIKNVAKGTNIFVPVTVKGKTYPFIFDTGAGSSFVSERFANEIGIRIIRDSVPIKGVETCIGKLGTIDSLMVGDIIFKNPIILVANNTPEVDSIFQVEAVLGLDFIKRAGETQIFPQEGKIVFPQHQSSLPPTGRNLLLEDGQSYIKALSGNERLRFHFDTGNVTGCLLKPYYFKHKEKIDATYTKETARHGGFCGYQTVEEYTLPHIPLKVGAVEFDFTDIKVAIDSVLTIEKTEDGSLGMDFIKKFKVITINYDKMFVEVEK